MTNEPAPQTQSCLLYDGACPICSTFAKIADRAEDGCLRKIDARQESNLREQATAAGMDLDYGIVVESEGRLYFGAEALHYLANRPPKSLKTTLLYLVFRSRRLTRVLYPLLVRMRWTLLWMTRTSSIRNLSSKG
jgi:predicted DCC family thiol-disulfide oxidoreductase YuxK